MIDFELIYNKFNYGELLEVEKRLHQKLPADLRKFLIDRGTGYIKKWGEQDFLTYPDDSIDASIEYFCSTKEYLQYVGLGVENGYWPLMPPCSIPFAWGPGLTGGYILKVQTLGKFLFSLTTLGRRRSLSIGILKQVQVFLMSSISLFWKIHSVN